ncbi:LacI family DNA-binding transcriptional regulator [Mycolicibacterium sp. J2]|uniref:LacI family DNA-binding transcriptional regulator n=1 Tax=Mycolicibacterium sp. J2 TaxID=2993511 RepID=UPI00224AF2F5|nr:LacI family DNA-binding transcriptional regulator [Mycolicibacterium sp. J2]MCX2715197.1 LacI family DNA-binding transcriptional regulator [Mycolicibacterium sp. J2]
MMHRYKVREIAQQCGLSEATVDRVLNDRPGVRQNTRAEVLQAIADLDKQRAQLRLNGRRFLVDVVMQTPQRFSDAFRAAIEAELPAFAPAMLRARFHLWESGSSAQMVEELGRIKGSHGVVLKAQDEPAVAEAVDRLVAAGVPVVTYTTDIPTSARCAYVGIDNHGAGVTAAYLMNQWLGSPRTQGADQTPRTRGADQTPRTQGADQIPGVLITLSRTVFRGEGEREVGFRSGLRGTGREIVEVSDGDGIDAANERLVLDALERHPGIEAVYSPGGGNTATVAAFDTLGRRCKVFIGHDLDADNRRLLRDGRISVVLHNDLRADARLAMRVILAQHGALPAEPVRPTPIQVVTPYNVPA